MLKRDKTEFDVLNLFHNSVKHFERRCEVGGAKEMHVVFLGSFLAWKSSKGEQKAVVFVPFL